MASIEERLEQVEHALTRMGQMQEQGQIQLGQALKQAEGLIGSAGKAVAGAMEASAEQAAQAHLAVLMRVVDEVATASKGTVAEASKAVQDLRQSLQAEVQASQGMLKAVNTEAEKASGLMKRMGDQGTQGEETLKAIHAELVSMGQSVSAHKVQMGAAIKEAEAEAKKELRNLKESIGDMVPSYLVWFRGLFPAGVMLAAITGVGWGAYFAAKIYVEKNRAEEIRAEVVKDVKENLTVRAVVYGVVPNENGGLRVEPQGLRVPLVVQEDGSFRPMTRTADGRWAWGRNIWRPEQVVTAQVWQTKEGTVLKSDLP